jgi:hypothetical protein
MSRDKVTVAKEVRDVKAAEWEGFQRLAERLPNHHILAVELIRTRDNQTAAVFTIVRDGRPFQTVVMGDARGQVNPKDCSPRPVTHDAVHGVEAKLASPDSLGDDSTSPDIIALGGPPPKQPVDPAIVSLGTVLLSSTFNLGEQVVVTDPSNQ